MWVFRDDSRIADAGAVLGQCRGRWRSLLSRRIPEHQAAVDLLIRIGELESALVDKSAPGRDITSGLTEALRCIAISCAHMLRAAWRGEEVDSPWVRQASTERAFEHIGRVAGTWRIQLRTPEGYAYYSLYPEMYLAAAKVFSDSAAAAPVLCLGLRSIGTSLSAVVAAELEARGWAVRSDTLRPRGAPWDRTVHIDPSLRGAWAPWLGGYCLIVDEGPGLSGSSFVGSAQAMERLGFERGRIVLFPSWDPPHWHLRSEAAQTVWPQYRKAHVSFESLWLDSERLYPGPLKDLSAGAWRGLFYEGEGGPAVQPYHERRKYLGPEPHGPFMKFVGLGPHGEPRYRRAAALAEMGLTPPVRGWSHGFLSMDRIPGVPLTPTPLPRPELLHSLVSYLAVLKRYFSTDAPVPVERHLELIHTNLSDSLGRKREWCLSRFGPLLEDRRAVLVDSRMLPHEWLRSGNGYIKSDVTDHHDDHFYPGEDDLAWDLAGGCIEFGFTPGTSRAMTERLGRAVGDRVLHRCLPFYNVAYLAYRIGYATMAADTLGDSPDGWRFRRLLAYYRRREQGAWAELETASRRKRWC